MPKQSKSNLKKFIKGFKRIIREEMYWASRRVPKAIAEACPAPGMKNSFDGKYSRTREGAGFEVTTNFQPVIAVFAMEFGRRGLPMRGKAAFPAGGYPLKVKTAIKTRRRGYGEKETVRGEKMYGREKEKFEEEGIVIRPGPIAPQRATFFISRTWGQELRNIKSRIGTRLEGLARRTAL